MVYPVSRRAPSPAGPECHYAYSHEGHAFINGALGIIIGEIDEVAQFMAIDVFHKAQEDVAAELHAQEGLIDALRLEKYRART